MMFINNKTQNTQIGAVVAFILALIGATSLIVIKYIAEKNLPKKWILIPVIINIASLFMVFIGLQFTTLTILNMQWNVISNIIVTLVGIFYFNEVHSYYEIIGLIFGIFSVMILSFEHLF